MINSKKIFSELFEPFPTNLTGMIELYVCHRKNPFVHCVTPTNRKKDKRDTLGSDYLVFIYLRGLI